MGRIGNAGNIKKGEFWTTGGVVNSGGNLRATCVWSERGGGAVEGGEFYGIPHRFRTGKREIQEELQREIEAGRYTVAAYEGRGRKERSECETGRKSARIK